MTCDHSWKNLEGQGDLDLGNYIRECTGCGMVERYTYWTNDDGTMRSNRTILATPRC
ncbi:MAG: hypothetical protein ACMUIG_01430 [Thermoplasmatota archaeon]